MMHSDALCHLLEIKLGKPVSTEQTTLTSSQPMAQYAAVWSAECLLVGAFLLKCTSAIPQQQLQLDTPTGTEV